ncbi:hypothetical protein L596_018776 [Steinernema carpocapsae]|uniref:Uncharacterized protein n=1 Tax=Steinernema carpocapsae TaxID=34508 RepID=A0A4U5N5M5_STECR|nr:hypothetical protein L596_018776 [Steinernema carpocapsae]
MYVFDANENANECIPRAQNEDKKVVDILNRLGKVQNLLVSFVKPQPHMCKLDMLCSCNHSKFFSISFVPILMFP